MNESIHKPVKPAEKTLEELAKEITQRGNDMQVTHSKNGLKIYEVSKKLVKEISG